MLDQTLLQSIRRGVSTLSRDRRLADRELQIHGIAQSVLADHGAALIERGEIEGVVVRLRDRQGLLVRRLTHQGAHNLRIVGGIDHDLTASISGCVTETSAARAGCE